MESQLDWKSGNPVASSPIVVVSKQAVSSMTEIWYRPGQGSDSDVEEIDRNGIEEKNLENLTTE